MRLRSLNSRLTLAAIAAVLLAVLVLGVGAQIIIGNRLQSSLASSLRKRAVEVARLSISAQARKRVVLATGWRTAPRAYDLKGARAR